MRQFGTSIGTLLVATTVACATTWHVDPVGGRDDGEGSAASPFATLMRAAAVVEPGDVVLAYPGVYYEHVKLERAGTAAAPITFRSTGGREKTIVTGANRDLREGRLRWEPAAGAPGIYQVPLALEPATVLCDELNLYRYPSLGELVSRTVNNVANQKRPAPGPKRGFAWADGLLYLRLDPSGRDGDPDPNTRVLKASPPRGRGFRGDEIDTRQRSNFSICPPGPAYVIVEGFTFESPGFCGVWVRHGQVTVRDCRFIGCRTGVRGWDHPEKKPRALSEDVVVEGCEFSEHPLYADAAEIIREVTALPEAERATMPRFFWWHRKGGPYSSEIGLVTAAGRRWTIRGNHIHDTLDGLSFMSLSWSEDCEVVGNRFERILDNAVEAENHAQRLRVRDNTVIDCFEPFSYQPLGGEPWPTDIVFERNTVGFTADGVELWGRDNLGWRPGCIKIRVPPEVRAVPDGLVFRDNLVWFPIGGLLSFSRDAVVLRGVRFERNVVAVRGLGGTADGLAPVHVEFADNHAVALAAEGVASLHTLVGTDGTLYEAAGALGLVGTDDRTGIPLTRPGSPAAAVGARLAP